MAAAQASADPVVAAVPVVVERFQGGGRGQTWAAAAAAAAAAGPATAAVAGAGAAPGQQAIDPVALASLAARVADPGISKDAAVAMIAEELSPVCGYPGTVEADSTGGGNGKPRVVGEVPWRCGRDYGCIELRRVSREGRTPAEQNFAYSLENHVDMVGDAPRVRACTRGVSPRVVL
jgi:hypothetical protein